MKRQLILRGVLGLPIGVTIGYMITIIHSLIWAGGSYAPCVPELAAAVGNEINGVIVQAMFTGMLGTGFGVCSVIWEIERWSLLKQTGIYFGIVSVMMMPVAYLLYWMEHSVYGFIVYFGIFVLIFTVIWVIQFAIAGYTVKRMNASLRQTGKGHGREK